MNNILLLVALIAGIDAAHIDWKIIGGSDAKDGQFPHHVSLQYKAMHNCAGSIISDTWILTAAHCVYEMKPDWLTVVVGTNKLSEPGERYDVEKLVAHEDYKAFRFDYDIGMVKVSRSIQFSDKVRPIGLYKEVLPGNEDVLLEGWGSTELGGETPDWLQMILLRTLDEETCREMMSSPEIKPAHLCTLTKTGEGACHGDSGGGLLCDNQVAGIVSFGTPCAKGFPDVFTRVSSYTDWILENMD